jgi:hypothetical protein
MIYMAVAQLGAFFRATGLGSTQGSEQVAKLVSNPSLIDVHVFLADGVTSDCAAGMALYVLKTVR